MRIVSIDSSLGSSLLVADAGPGTAGTALSVLSRAEQSSPRRHAESLGAMLARVLAAPGVADHPLDAVIAATGPAPFTGLRAGLVTARALGRARGVPVHGVPSLDAVARAAFDEIARAGGGGGESVLVVTDARRHEVYAARYRARGADDVEPLDSPAVLAPDAAVRLGGVDAVAGSGAVLYPHLAAGRVVLAPVSGDPAAQIRVALTRLADAGPGAVLPAEPLYLRHADVHMPAGRGRTL
ncbi:tRNA (adenosine(37)-N6)-threonylcarbamoyltransferase complex dimerization subunit type 1 TsaB [Actinomyces sp. oral taxon 448]|uniref:tRNA (adenosine(37)-N6)-threonylcarbamoyltransferase complex dimerization subunit type 1 TsaB n=1 Tax=Actinomyces sp. oral taxon 448 TaxID=712124 RepID=UPI000558FFD4|nr:tRNA (adenosine(37)-N6)-threonylcarbamoyltransferase complex dimerization subunit type 1 TsaB [Actinomyces sp. oral taxon 448]